MLELNHNLKLKVHTLLKICSALGSCWSVVELKITAVAPGNFQLAAYFFSTFLHICCKASFPTALWKMHAHPRLHGSALRCAALRYTVLWCELSYALSEPTHRDFWLVDTCWGQQFSEVPISMQHSGDTCDHTQHHRNKALIVKNLSCIRREKCKLPCHWGKWWAALCSVCHTVPFKDASIHMYSNYFTRKHKLFAL